jgi:hypothetical protein
MASVGVLHWRRSLCAANIILDGVFDFLKPRKHQQSRLKHDDPHGIGKKEVETSTSVISTLNAYILYHLLAGALQPKRRVRRDAWALMLCVCLHLTTLEITS